jgi:hypothetical protein
VKTSYLAFQKSLKTEAPEPQSLQPLLALAKKLGLYVTFLDLEHHNVSKNYTAKTQFIELPIQSKPCAEQFSNLAHELGHFIAATPEERILDNYGLFRSPDDASSLFWEEGKNFSNNHHYLQQKEKEASIAGMILEMILGYSPRFTFDLHNWKYEEFDIKKNFDIVIPKIRALKTHFNP